MAEPHVIYALKAKRSELAGRIMLAQKEIEQMRQDLVHVDATLAIFGFEQDPKSLPPRKYKKELRLFERNELRRMLLDALRTAPDGLSTPDLALHIMALKEWDTSDNKLKSEIADRIGNSLRKILDRGVIEKRRQGLTNVWKVV
jgi:hypothetical protein